MVFAQGRGQRLTVKTASENRAALALYVSTGFEELERSQTPEGIALSTLGWAPEHGGGAARDGGAADDGAADDGAAGDG